MDIEITTNPAKPKACTVNGNHFVCLLVDDENNQLSVRRADSRQI